MAMPTAVEILSRYLYNQDTPPENKADAGLIRDKNDTQSEELKGSPLSVDAVEYMTSGGGRFINISCFNYVVNFLDSNDYEGGKPQGSASLLPGEYTTTDILRLYGIVTDPTNLDDLRKSFVGIQQYYLGMDDADYVDRAYVFGSSEFQINAEAKFIVDEDGTRWITNIWVVPVDDNFNYVSDSLAAQITNSLTKDLIDPSGIGRTVDIEFINTEALSTLNNDAYKIYGVDDLLALKMANEQFWKEYVQLDDVVKEFLRVFT